MPVKNYPSLLVTLFLFLLLVSAVPTLANEPESYPFYGGFTLGFSQADQDCSYDYYDNDSQCDGDDTSFSFYGGKRFHKNLAFEVTYLDLGKLDNEKGHSTTTAETTGVNFSMLGIIPFESTGYLYGKAGIMAWQTDYTTDESGITSTSDDDGTDFTFGIGYAFIFQDSYELRIEFERLNELNDEFNDGGSHITNLSIGGNFYFQ